VKAIFFFSIFLSSGLYAQSDSLLRVLAAKGVITSEELTQIAAADVSEQRFRLARLLHAKGVLTDAELAEVTGTLQPTRAFVASAVPVIPKSMAAAFSAATPLSPAAGSSAATALVQPKPVIPAVVPIRVLQVDPVKRDGLIPDIRLTSGAKLKLYGMIKASAIFDSSSPSGTDMPLPYLGGDTGPTVDPEFHVRARNMRLGAHFEWLDLSPKTVLTGRFETDYEGSFTRAMNRNISSVRSSQMSLRVAWARLDHNFSERNTWFVLAGQDWTPFGSSTLPNLFETTGLGLGFGTLYERAPQIRTGWIHTAGGSRNLKFLPEIALSLPAFGNTPANVADQLGYGERQGADSGRPEIQGRIVAQWQFDKAPGVAPAQFIVSFVQASRKALVTAASVPNAFRTAFPNGAEVSSGRYGYSLELQLPTRAVTFTGKYYNGQDLRFYFVGGLFSNFNDTAGITGQVTASSIDAASTVVFGYRNGIPVVAPQRPVRTQGYMADLGLPISRWLHADPSGRAAGWTANLHYSIDMVPARDVRRLSCLRNKSDLAAATLYYRLNSMVSFGIEQSMYRTRAANSSAADPGGLFLIRGIPSRQWHDNRTEIGPIFTF
jgi:hypothetical protein